MLHAAKHEGARGSESPVHVDDGGETGAQVLAVVRGQRRPLGHLPEHGQVRAVVAGELERHEAPAGQEIDPGTQEAGGFGQGAGRRGAGAGPEAGYSGGSRRAAAAARTPRGPGLCWPGGAAAPSGCGAHRSHGGRRQPRRSATGSSAHPTNRSRRRRPNLLCRGAGASVTDEARRRKGGCRPAWRANFCARSTRYGFRQGPCPRAEGPTHGVRGGCTARHVGFHAPLRHFASGGDARGGGGSRRGHAGRRGHAHRPRGAGPRGCACRSGRARGGRRSRTGEGRGVEVHPVGLLAAVHAVAPRAQP